MQQQATAGLPAPDEQTQQHSRRCSDHIRDRIAAAGGSLSFAEFMHEALYAPGLGYYTAGTTKFGSAGDFVTAPELSPLFARVLARSIAPVLAEPGHGDLLELGAGSGRLAADLLEALDAIGAPPRHYAIFEVSPELEERQRHTIAALPDALAGRVEWLSLPPDEHRGVIIANEVLDALPVERFRRSDAGILQLRVAATETGFVLVDRPAPADLAQAVEQIESDLGMRLAAGYTSEANLAAAAWIDELAASLRSGLALIIDYGVSRREYYAQDRSDGWLRCHFRHHAHSDPLRLVGVQDLTAWVDFTAVAEAAASGGLDIAGYLSQGAFMINSGLAIELEQSVNLPPASQLELSSAVKLLTMPGGMGEHIKVMGLTRGNMPGIPGFARGDRTHTL